MDGIYEVDLNLHHVLISAQSIAGWASNLKYLVILHYIIRMLVTDVPMDTGYLNERLAALTDLSVRSFPSCPSMKEERWAQAHREGSASGHREEYRLE